MPIENEEKQQEYMEENKNEEEFLNGVNQFSSNSMALVFAENKQNIAYSPLSAYFALAMAAEGANGTTKD